MLIAQIVALTSLVTWLGLLAVRGGFWIPRPKLEAKPASPAPPWTAPRVVAIIPARNEADVLPSTLPTVLGQEFGGSLRVILVDDQSGDATALVARNTAASCSSPDRLVVLTGQPLPDGWAGKVWAMHQGLEHAGDSDPDYIWFTDADIAHAPGMLETLVRKASSDRLDLVSLMAQLQIGSSWDRLLIPAFVYFFAKLYPFRLVSDPAKRAAGAAGGCVLVRREALSRAGGLRAIHSALIDDCALGKLIKAGGGRIFLGFTRSVRSIRPYETLRSVWDMVARSAFHQLGYSVVKLLGTLVGMLLIYAVPPAAVLIGITAAVAGHAHGARLALLGLASWGLMSLSFVPILKFQGSRGRLAPLLPVAGVLYTSMTLSSAWRHVSGRSGIWKGRSFSGSRQS